MTDLFNKMLEYCFIAQCKENRIKVELCIVYCILYIFVHSHSIYIYIYILYNVCIVT